MSFVIQTPLNHEKIFRVSLSRLTNAKLGLQIFISFNNKFEYLLKHVNKML